MPFTPENVKNFLGNVPLGRLTDPTDVAKAALFLGMCLVSRVWRVVRWLTPSVLIASDDGKFITGVNMEVDGGRGV